MKRYNYSQHLCYDCSTIERESELSTAVVPLIPVSLQPFILVHYLRTFTSVYPYNPFFVPLQYAEKEGSMLLQPKNRCMQDACSCSYEQHVLVCKHVYTYKFIMITFPENYL